MRASCTILTALAVMAPIVNAAPAVGFWGKDRCGKCIDATPYTGSRMTAHDMRKNQNGKSDASSGTGNFLHITDIHIDELYLVGSDPVNTQCHRVNNTNPSLNVAGKYGTLGSQCDTPQTLMDATFTWMKNNVRDVDFIIYTGDSARHDRDPQVPRANTPSATLDEHRMVADKISSTFDMSKTTYIPTWGNNDQLIYNKMNGTNDPVIASLTTILAPFNLGLDSSPSWKKGGYFSYEVKPGLVVLSLNSMLLFSSNKLTTDCSLATSAGKEMLSWANDTLTSLQAAGKKAYIMQHVPPTSVTGAELYYPGCQSQYVNLIGSHAKTIISSFFGHTNSDYVSFIYTNNTASPANGPFFLSTVTNTPPTLDFTKNCVLHVMSQGPSIIPSNNPAVRVYSYSRQGDSLGALLGYVQYWSDLTKDNANDAVDYAVEYRTYSAYGLFNLAPFSWAKVFAGWAKNASSFQNYVRYQNVLGN
ncbi:Metallo-dependent phosphatase-like protein [Geranomyces variabilis]|nr:Metallo-dependent phosphatase-like protein [Geranomyces variabilis]KAJ3141247.1 Endopolyphosphatase [Geranomyces variabilis]